MSWLSDIASSHRLQLGLTAVASGFLAASAVVGLQEARKWYNERDLKDSIPGLNQPHDVEKVRCFTDDALTALTDASSDKRVRRRLAGGSPGHHRGGEECCSGAEGADRGLR